MFPFDIDDEELDTEADDEEPLRDYEIDFRTGQLTGRLIEGLDVIKQRVNIIFGTARYRYGQYSWDHGCELENLIGKNYQPDYIESEAKRMITEALQDEDYIDEITDFKIFTSNHGETLTVACTLVTPYGNAEVNYDV